MGELIYVAKMHGGLSQESKQTPRDQTDEWMANSRCSVPEVGKKRLMMADNCFPATLIVTCCLQLDA